MAQEEVDVEWLRQLMADATNQKLPDRHPLPPRPPGETRKPWPVPDLMYTPPASAEESLDGIYSAEFCVPRTPETVCSDSHYFTPPRVGPKKPRVVCGVCLNSIPTMSRPTAAVIMCHPACLARLVRIASHTLV